MAAGIKSAIGLFLPARALEHFYFFIIDRTKISH
jgi:hypothetical protein